MEIYTKKKRQKDLETADQLQQSANDLRSEAFDDSARGYLKVARAVFTPSLIDTGVSAYKAKKKFEEAENKKILAAACDDVAQELRDKAENAPTFSFGKKKK